MSLTLENIHQLFVYLSEVQSLDEKIIHHSKRLAFSYNGCINMDNNLLSNSYSSIDINNLSGPLVTATPEISLLQLTSSRPLSIEGGINIKRRFVPKNIISYGIFENPVCADLVAL